MSTAAKSVNIEEVLSRAQNAVSDGKLTGGAEENLARWIKEPQYSAYAPAIAQHVAEGRWKELDDAFWTVIPFGTGGRRGRMYPFGSNTINDRTIGESAQGLADYVREQLGSKGELSCAIAYDTRHRSRQFAELCAGIMVGAGFKVYFLNGYRSTPELSFTVGYKKCACGIMVTASHNPPSDNAVKVYWSNGAQVLPPHDKGIIERVMSVEEIRAVPFESALAARQVIYCQDEVDKAYLDAVLQQAFPGPRDVKIIYSPLHGVGEMPVRAALTADGFKSVETFGPHAEQSGDFPNVPDHVSNPENTAVFDAMIGRGREIEADVILASDPDCDRLGCAAPLTANRRGEWKTLTGNQIGALLAEYVLEARKKAGKLTRDSFIIETLVTTQMIRRIGDSYGVKTFGNIHVGFKWIAATIDEKGADRFIYGTEESHGYMVGDYVRDKDGVVAAMLMAELAAQSKAAGKTLHEKLDSLFWQYGYHAEETVSVFMRGSEGMKNMQAVMARLRSQPPETIAGMKVIQIRDYLNLKVTQLGGSPKPLEAPKGDMVILDLEAEGYYVAVRPSGTEPKIKFYVFGYQPPELLANLEDTKEETGARLAAMMENLSAWALNG